MKLKDYLLDRLIYIVLYFVSNILVIIVMMLDLIIKNEELNLGNILYGLLLSTVVLVTIIIIDYLRKRRFYKIINEALEKDDNVDYIFSIPDNIDKEHDTLKYLFNRNYNIYQNTLDRYRKAYKTQIDFKSRWIHQMKTPVSVISLILENEKDKNVHAPTNKSYESIEEEIQRLSHGLEMALYTLRINDFEEDFKVEEVDIIDVIRLVINENKNTFIVNSVYPKVLGEENIKVVTDKKWIKFTISQIISNSIKYTKVKDIDNKWIQVTLHKEGNKNVVSIEDNGVGIASEDLERVFNPFFTGKNGRKYSESTGMGLYLAKDICNKLGHRLEVESQEGKGTKIIITFYDGKSIYNVS